MTFTRWLRCLCSLGSLLSLGLLLLCLFVLRRLWRDRLFGSSLLFPPAAPVGCAPLLFLLRQSGPLAFCRTLSFCCCFSPRFLPLALVQAWVGGLGPCLGSSLLFFFFFFGGGALFPLSSLFSLGFSNSFVVQAPYISWIFAGVSFLSLPVFADSSGWLEYCPWLSILRCLATGGVTFFFFFFFFFFCQWPFGLPWWVCGASGFLGPAGFRVFAMGSPASGRNCVLPQSAIVTKTFPPYGGFGSWPSC